MANITGTAANDVLNGTAANDVISGAGGNDTLNGALGNDRLIGGIGNDVLNGGGGDDAAAYAGAMSGYRLQYVNGNVRVVDVNAADGNMGTDTLTGIERVSFGDGTITVTSLFSEFRANTYTTGSQLMPVVAGLNAGGFVIAWSSDGQDGDLRGIYGQRYAANGTAVGGEMHISTTATGSQTLPSMTALSDGGFVLTWESGGQDGSVEGVIGQRYDANGAAVGGEFQVNTTTAGAQHQTSITALSGGGFVVTWAAAGGQDGSAYGVYGRLYDSNGAPLTGEFRVNSHTAGDQATPAAAGLSGGGFVVTWVSDAQDGAGYGVYAQVYEADGDPVGIEFRVNTATADFQWQPAVTGLTNGGFVVTWASNLQDGDQYGIYAQRFDADGDPVGVEFRINSGIANEQSNPSVTALSGGRFVVTWHSWMGDTSDYGIVARLFDANGNPVGGDVVVNTTIGGSQLTPQVDALADGGFVITWQSLNQDGSGYGVYAQRFDVNGRAYVVQLDGDAGNNTLSFAGGSARMAGKAGNDTYIVDNAGDGIVENVGEGTDVIQTSVSYSLGANVENLVLTGTLNINGFGNTAANDLTGNSGNNVLNGGLGADILRGGLGNDSYVLTSGDAVVENANAGTDTVTADFNYTLGANVENLTLTGGVGRTGTGNVLANRIFGTSGNDTLLGAGGNDAITGGAGNDTINGGEGADAMVGAAGADRFVYGSITNSTVAGAGRDTVYFVQGDADKIVLSAIDADTDGTAGDQAFTFIGNAAFSGVDGQLRYAASGGNTIVYGDVNGDSVADFSLLIVGNVALLGSDFIL